MVIPLWQKWSQVLAWSRYYIKIKDRVVTRALEFELQLQVHTEVIILLLLMLTNSSYAGMWTQVIIKLTFCYVAYP